MTVDVEQILVVPTLLFHEVGYFQGFCGDADRYLSTLLDPIHTAHREARLLSAARSLLCG